MNWKRSLSDVFILTGMNFAVFSLSLWKKGESYFNSHHLIESALEAIAIGLMVIGLRKLDLGRHPRVRRIIGICVMAFFLGLFVLIIILFIKRTMAVSNLTILYHHRLALLAVSPIVLYGILALYVIRRWVKSISQSTVDNAS